MNSTVSQIVELANKTLAQNKECFMAQWILQNPDKNVGDYILCTRYGWVAGYDEYWMERKYE